MKAMAKDYTAPKPVEETDILEVTIESVSAKGEGIARVEGFILFVKNAKQGETCRVRIKDVKRTYAIAEKV
ncbi:TRAM domain-containing protein [Candidatus Micrarchaeota archaeon]|nr:TRAM domain-containing protein [Candidatus Micrarchaeota archaeon]